MPDEVGPMEFHRHEGVEDWRVVGDGASAHFRTASFSASARFAAAIGELEGINEHPPDVDMRANGVTVRLVTCNRDIYGVTTADVDVARRISAIARDQRHVPDASAVQSLVVIPGALDTAAVIPFWRAMLGYEPRPDNPGEDLVDPHGRGPAFWFERMDEARADGNGTIHVAIWVPHDQAEARLKAAQAAGGWMVRDQFAPSFWTLADAAGNEADIATAMDRG